MSYGGFTPDEGEPSGWDDQRRRQAALRGLAKQAGQQGWANRTSQASQASQPSQTHDASGQAVTQPRLRRVASQTSQPSQRPTHTRRPPALLRKPRRWGKLPAIILIAAVVVALVAGAGVWAVKSGRLGRTASQPPAPVMPAVRSINLSAYNLSCPVQPTWSPDGTQIALSATLGDCTNQYTGGKELAIFDARTGKLTHGYALNDVLIKHGLPTALAPSPFAWAPDGSSLSFTVGYDPNQRLPAGTPHGLVTITLATGAARFVADTAPLPQPQEGETLIWDIKTGKLAHTIGELAPAAAYTWGADGSLAPSAAGSAGAVSVWRVGVLNPVFPAASNEDISPLANQNVPQSFVYAAISPGWSPDGRYLALPLAIGARVPGGPSAFPIASCPDGLTLVCQTAPTPAPDKGFSAALAAFEAGWTPSPQQSPFWNPQDIAWRADGQELATLLPGQDFNTQKPTAIVTIFNTRTGAVVKALAINRVTVNVNVFSELPQIAWSPRGASLAALNSGDATLTLWRAE